MPAACREPVIEVVFVTIALLVDDCRDVSLVHHRRQLLAVAKSKEAEIPEDTKPLENEVVSSKGCCDTFDGTNLDQTPGNMRTGTRTSALEPRITAWKPRREMRASGTTM